MWLQIKPGLRVAWRGPTSVQIGLDPGRGVVVDGLTATDRAVIELLVAGVDESALPFRPETDAPRARSLVQLLARSGVLVDRRSGRDVLARLARDAPRLEADAAVWSVVHEGAGDSWDLLARRAARAVEVRGAGRAGSALATVLAAAGVGQVDLVDDGSVTPADVAPAGAAWAEVGRGAEESGRRAQEALRPPQQFAQPVVPSPGAQEPAGGPDVVVLVHASTADSAAASGLVEAGVAHLPLVVRERGLVVGPLVLPGRAPCLRCLDLHRADRDESWPQVAAQLARRGSRAPVETASALLAASLAALQVLAHLDGFARPAALGATLEVELPDGLVSRRPWPPHAACDCTSRGPAGHRGRSGAREGRISA